MLLAWRGKLYVMFGSEFFAGNRARLRELFTGTAPIIIASNGLLQRASDEAYPFHQDANFWYLTGLDEPDLILILDKTKEYLVVPGRSASREAFDGAIDPTGLTRRSGISDIVDAEEGWRQLEKRLKKSKHVATLAAGPAYIDAIGLYTNPARGALIHRLKQVNAELELLDLREHLARMRMIKQPQELLALQHAMDITAATLKEVARPARLAKYRYEYEIEADITRGFRRRGAQGHGFSPIAASGLRACTLHSVANESALASDELIVLDVGAEADHYVADITRTYPLGKNVPRRAELVYEAVRGVHDFAITQLRPGVLLHDYEQQVEAFMGEKLRELNLIKVIEHDTVRRYFPHAASHFLGLNAHDAGDYERPLEPGVVLTVEPGIYIPEEAIGVRIEDDVLITPEGNRVMTSALPYTLA